MTLFQAARQRGWRAIVPVLVILGLLSACSSSKAPTGTPAPTGSGQPAQSSQPAKDEPPNPNNTFSWSGRVMDKSNPILDTSLDRTVLYIFDGLVRFTADLQPTGSLAEKWEISPDGKTYTFFLRKNVKWHDGKPFTADDVLFTAQAALNPANKSGMAARFMVNGKPVTVTKVDDHTVKMELPFPSNAFLFNMFMARFVPKHLLDGVDMATTPFNQKPIGTGPWMVMDFQPKQRMMMKANPDYFLGAPKIKYWVFNGIEEQNAALAALASGQLTGTGVGGKASRETALKLNGVKVQGYDSGWTFSMIFNMTHGVVGDKAVRQAVAYAIDREKMVKTIAGDDVTVAWSAIGPTNTWQYNDKVPKYPQDVAKAKQILADAGWKDSNGNGTVDKDGKEAQFTVLVQAKATDSDPVPFALAIQQALAAIGIKMEITQLDRASLEPRVLQASDFDAYLWWDGYSFVPDMTLKWYGANNRAQFKHPELEQLIDTANTTPDQKLRKESLDKLSMIFAEELPVIPLYYYRGYVAIRDHVGNVPPPSAADPNNTGIFYETWNMTLGK